MKCEWEIGKFIRFYKTVSITKLYSYTIEKNASLSNYIICFIWKYSN